MAGKRKQTDEEPKTHWTPAGGFRAFDPNVPHPKKRKMKRRWRNGVTGTKRPKFVECKEFPEPKFGIHSLAWAQAIAPQTSGLFKLPIEIRNRIYKHVIDGWTCGREDGGSITPWRRGCKFHDKDWSNAKNETTALYLLCRQAYVDVVGGSLLYSFRKFFFTSPPTMLNYLWVINPRHKDSIRNIHLDIKMWTYMQCLDDASPPKCGRPFEMIASCKNLRHFVLNLRIWGSQYEIQWEQANWYSPRHAKSISVSKKFLQGVLKSTALRSIRGLKSFEMLFTPERPDCESRYHWVRTPDPPFDEESQMRLIKVVDEIRSLVTQDPE